MLGIASSRISNNDSKSSEYDYSILSPHSKYHSQSLNLVARPILLVFLH